MLLPMKRMRLLGWIFAFLSLLTFLSIFVIIFTFKHSLLIFVLIMISLVLTGGFLTSSMILIAINTDNKDHVSTIDNNSVNQRETTNHALRTNRQIPARNEFKKVESLTSRTLITKPPEQLEEEEKEGLTIKCYTCGDNFNYTEEFCVSCGSPRPRCIICLLYLLPDDLNIVKTPCCNMYAHKTHLKAWLSTSSICPHCKGRLTEEDLE